jgi:hypothetical protein
MIQDVKQENRVLNLSISISTKNLAPIQIEGCDVLGLLATPDNARVTGVRVIRRRADSAEESLSADLIVDTTGRGSRSPAWLEALGYERSPTRDNLPDLAWDKVT